jgi:hypothetical protein
MSLLTSTSSRLRPTLDDYRRHSELYGPELIVETAAYDLDEREVSELRSYVRHLERTKRWRGSRWDERRVTRRPCQECGLDLPADAKADMRRHVHCRERAAKRRARARARGMGQRVQEGPARASLGAKRDVQDAA